MTYENRARQTTDALLIAAGWRVCDVAKTNVQAGCRWNLEKWAYGARQRITVHINLYRPTMSQLRRVGTNLSGEEEKSSGDMAA